MFGSILTLEQLEQLSFNKGKGNNIDINDKNNNFN